eukprot:scaffold21260_cov58-Phaeocystis_antarctica.AAC.3
MAAAAVVVPAAHAAAVSRAAGSGAGSGSGSGSGFGSGSGAAAAFAASGLPLPPSSSLARLCVGKATRSNNGSGGSSKRLLFLTAAVAQRIRVAGGRIPGLRLAYGRRVHLRGRRRTLHPWEHRRCTPLPLLQIQICISNGSGGRIKTRRKAARHLHLLGRTPLVDRALQRLVRLDALVLVSKALGVTTLCRPALAPPRHVVD